MAADSTPNAQQGLSVTVERPDASTARVSFEVTKAEFEKLRDRGLKNVSRQTKMKGFRPGKTPRKVVEKTHGAFVEKQVIEHFVNSAYNDAIKEHELVPATHPRVDVDALERAEDGTFKHSFDVLLKPTVELGEYKGLTVETLPTEVTEEEFDNMMTNLRAQHSRPETADENEGILEDGMAVCKIRFDQEGVDEPVLERDGVRLSPSAPPSGIDADEYKEQMVGKKVGESFQVAIEYPELFPVESARGGKGTCHVELSEVFRIVAPDDEELQRVLGMEDAEDFQGEVKKRLGEAKVEQEERRLEASLIEQLIEAHPMDIPPALVEAQATAKVEELRSNLPEGLDEAEIEARLAQERAEAIASQSHAMRALYLIEAVAQKEDIQVTREDISSEVKKIAEQNGASVADVQKYYQENNLAQQLVMELLERKVRGVLLESAVRQPAAE